MCSIPVSAMQCNIRVGNAGWAGLGWLGPELEYLCTTVQSPSLYSLKKGEGGLEVWYWELFMKLGRGTDKAWLMLRSDAHCVAYLECKIISHHLLPLILSMDMIFVLSQG